MGVPAVCGASSTAAKKRVRLSLASCRTEPAAVAAVAARHGRSLSKARLKRVSPKTCLGSCPGSASLGFEPCVAKGLATPSVAKGATPSVWLRGLPLVCG